MAVLGEADYRNGAKERLREAFVLLRQELFSGAIYLAGRAVEGMLRALIWRSDPAYAQRTRFLETGHDLRKLLAQAGNLGAFSGQRGQIALSISRGALEKVARLWDNNMRFWPTSQVKRRWFAIGQIGKRRTMKQAVAEYCDSCLKIIKRCEETCDGKKTD